MTPQHSPTSFTGCNSITLYSYFNAFNLKGYKLGLVEVYAATWQSATKDILSAHSKGFGNSFADVSKLVFNPKDHAGTGLSQSGDLVFTMAPGSEPGFTLQLPNQLDPSTNKPDIDKVAMIFNSGWVENSAGQLLPVEAGTIRYHTIMHELGHALGLSHVREFDNITGAVTVRFLGDASFDFDYLDSQKYTIMSYMAYDASGNSNSVRPSTLQLLDIAALQEHFTQPGMGTRCMT